MPRLCFMGSPAAECLDKLHRDPNHCCRLSFMESPAIGCMARLCFMGSPATWCLGPSSWGSQLLDPITNPSMATHIPPKIMLSLISV